MFRVRMGIALVQENKRIFRDRTFEENLRLGGFWNHRGRKVLAAAIEAEFDRFPVLRAKSSVPASTLSGGEQQMLAISQALLARPCADHAGRADGGPAPNVVKRLMGAIADLKRRGLAVLLVEQQVHAALKVADQVFVLELGRVTLTKHVSKKRDAGEIEEIYFEGSRLQSSQ